MNYINKNIETINLIDSWARETTLFTRELL